MYSYMREFNNEEFELLIGLLENAQDADMKKIEKSEAELEAAKKHFAVAQKLQERFRKHREDEDEAD